MFQNQESLKIQDGFLCVETLSYQSELPSGARFSTLAGPLDVTFYAPGIVRLQFDPQDKPDYGLLAQDPDANLEIQITEIPQGYRLQAGDVSLELLSSPMRVVLKKGGKTLLESVTDRAFLGDLRWLPFARSEDGWLAAFALRSGAPVYGLGEKFGPLNRKGQLVDSWNEDATTLNSELSYKNVPFAWSPAGWGLFTHTTSQVIHAVGYPQWSHRSYILNVHDQDLDLFLLAADSPAEMLAKYTALTGRTQELPRWSYGVWMSRAYYKTAEETLEVAQKLRKHEIPCDVLVLDGRAWHKMETRFDFQWDADRYPNPVGFVGQLKEENLKLCLWEYPYISVKNPQFTELAEKKYLLQTKDGQPYIHRWLPDSNDSPYPHLPPSGIIDFTNPDAYRWYGEAHKPLFDIGVSVMKTDYGESIPEDVVAHNGDTGRRLHNVYSLLYNQCVYDATKKYSRDGAMVWGRAGWAGSQRCPMQWGGDPQCDWEGLAASIRGGLSYGMSGGPYYSHDIGGFAVGNPPPDLYIRWAQAGVMMSHTRFHGAGQREPWFYGEEAEAIIKKWLAWRYQLIPYLQACALEASQNGLPAMRAMPLAFSEDPLAWGFEEQYMLGPSLLVVPVLVPENKVRFYLPKGGWYDLWSGEHFEGSQLMERTVPLDHIPVFGRTGTVLPLGPAVQHTGELDPDFHLSDLWVFGELKESITLPGLDLSVGNGVIRNLPDHVQVKIWK
ncbi:MAG: glycoside hydrolase family 31 protein [Anaerolineales bacterium]|nr:glycoside hydrolase family 31 protein [Anaerolineales bacterium]